MPLIPFGNSAENKVAELFFDSVHDALSKSLSLTHTHLAVVNFFFFYDAEGTHRLLKGRADGNHACPPTGRRAKPGVARCQRRVRSHAGQTEQPATACMRPAA